MARSYYCFAADIHVYFVTMSDRNLTRLTELRDRIRPGSDIFQTNYPQTYGIPHRA
jgi:hypothetical protein